jgi:BolA protein
MITLDTVKKVTCDVIHQHLIAALHPDVLDVIDDSDAHFGHAGAAAGGHYIVRINSPLFVGKSRLACHRLVYDALHEFINNGIHALAIEICPSNSD